MDVPKYMTLEKKDNHKLLTFFGVFIAFIVVTFFLYMLARKNETSVYVPIVAVAIPLLAAIGANYMGKKSDEKKRDNHDSWSGNDEDLTKTKKSRFSKFRPLGANISYFGFILSLISTYLSIYLSEVLNLTKILQITYPNDSFLAIFIDVVKNIFKADWSRKYLIQYWLWATAFIIIMAIAVIFGQKNLEKIKRKEQEQREKNKNNNISKFN